MEKTIDLNNAQLEALRTLPGVGSTLAERIVAARPFESIEELRKVSGVGPALFERLAPLLTLDVSESQGGENQAESEKFLPPVEPEIPPEAEIPIEPDETPTAEPPPEAEQPDAPQGGAAKPEAEPIPKEKAIIPVKKAEKEQAKPANPVTWGRVWLLVTAFSLGSFIFAVLMTLGIIGTINNGLRYASPGDLGTLNRQYDNLDSQISIVQDDIEGLRSRLDNLESMSTQLDELTTATEQLNADMAITEDIVTEMESQIEELESSTAGFQSFLDGLSELLTSLAGPAPEEAPQEVP
jgi:prefoldin subunit 5